jgi:cyclohexa-1,5-dienecarbonyl-CoA hydratase
VPVVAAIHGPTLGGGCEVAAACDLVLAADDVRLGQPEIRLGVFPPAAAALLPRLVGRQRALDLLLTGRTVLAEEALRLGLVTRVLPRDGFEEGVEAFVQELAARSRPVLALAKRAVVENLERPLSAALDAADHLYLTELMALRDPHEGLAAFMEKREPVWTNT